MEIFLWWIGTCTYMNFILIVICFAVIRRKMKKDAKWKHGVSVSYRTDTELATLRQYPMTIVQKDNSLYAVT